MFYFDYITVCCNIQYVCLCSFLFSVFAICVCTFLSIMHESTFSPSLQMPDRMHVKGPISQELILFSHEIGPVCSFRVLLCYHCVCISGTSDTNADMLHLHDFRAAGRKDLPLAVSQDPVRDKNVVILYAVHRDHCLVPEFAGINSQNTLRAAPDRLSLEKGFIGSRR